MTKETPVGSKQVPAPKLYDVQYTTLAFQWDGKTSMDPHDKTLPKWLKNYILDNKVQSTINLKTSVVNFGNKRGHYVALPGDWICLDTFGHLFVISSKTFSQRCVEHKKI